MSTRCLTRVFDGEEEIACLYRHHDGYPDGHGAELQEFIRDLRIVNEYSGRATIAKERMANGAGRMAAMIVAHFEVNAPMVIMPPGMEDCGQDYEYHVHCPVIMVLDNKPDGLPAKLTAYLCRRDQALEPVSLEEGS